MADDVQNPEVPEEEAPKKKKKKKTGGGGGMSMPVMLVIIGSILAVLVVGAFIVNNMMVSNIIESKLKNAGLDSSTVLSKMSEENELYAKKLAERMQLDEIMKEMENDDFYSDDEGITYAETERLLNNPKGATVVVILKLGFELREKPLSEEEEETSEEEAIVPSPAQFFKDNPVLSAKTKGIINEMFAAMTLEEFQQIRPELSDVIANKTRDMFKKEKIWLRKVLILEYLVQE